MTLIAAPTTGEAPGTPSTPTRTGRTTTSLTLATTAGSGGAPTTYRWRISTNSNVTDSDPMHTSSSPSITISGLDAGTNYWIDVRGENSEGDSSYSGDLATSTLGSVTTTVTANAGPDKSEEQGSPITIGGDDTIVNPVGSTTYSWSRVSGSGSFDGSTTDRTTRVRSNSVGTGVYRKTTTNNGVSDTDDVSATWVSQK